MSKFFGAAALAGAVLLGSVLPSSAATTSLGTLSDGDNPPIGNAAIAPKTTFTDLFTFHVDSMYTVSASITNVGAVITNFIMKLYTNSGTAANPVTATLVATSNLDTTKPQTLQFGVSPIVSINAGDYVVSVSGTTAANNNKTTSYGGNLSVSAVPLPSSVALFGVAVLGLGIAGMARRKGALGAAKA